MSGSSSPRPRAGAGVELVTATWPPGGSRRVRGVKIIVHCAGGPKATGQGQAPSWRRREPARALVNLVCRADGSGHSRLDRPCSAPFGPSGRRAVVPAPAAWTRCGHPVPDLLCCVLQLAKLRSPGPARFQVPAVDPPRWGPVVASPQPPPPGPTWPSAGEGMTTLLRATASPRQAPPIVRSTSLATRPRDPGRCQPCP